MYVYVHTTQLRYTWWNFIGFSKLPSPFNANFVFFKSFFSLYFIKDSIYIYFLTCTETFKIYLDIIRCTIELYSIELWYIEENLSNII